MGRTGQNQISNQETRRRPPNRRLFAYPIALAAVALAVLPMHDSEAVINGNTVADAPSWSVALSGDGYCSGSLIAPNLVLTAAHCDGMKTATIGATNVNHIPTSGMDGLVRDIIGFEANPNGDDAAVYRLSHSADYAKIEISTADAHLEPQATTLFGYGIVNERPAELDLVIHSVDGISTPCDNGYVTTPSEFCLKSSASDQSPCAGDSGAPIVTADGTLAAVYHGHVTEIGRKGPVCTAATSWSATSVTTESMRTWLTSMINESA